MDIKINYGDAVCAIPARALAERDAERADLLVLMQLCSDPYSAENIPLLAKRIGCTQKKVLSSIEFWREAGIITVENADTTSAASANPAAASAAHVSDASAASAASASTATASTVPEPAGEGGASRFELRPQYSGEELAALTDAHGYEDSMNSNAGEKHE